MVQCWWCVAWAVSSAAAADCGVCWTRNGVASLNATALEGKLAGVWLSATLLRRGDPALRTCLVTDAPAALARRALDATSARAGEAPGLIGLVVAVAQAGAMVARRTSGTRAFVGDWLDGFLKYLPPGLARRRHRPVDEAPDRVAGREFGGTSRRSTSSSRRVRAGAARRAWTLGKLPAALNVRKANAQPVLVWGKHVTLHTKQLTTNARPVESRGLSLAADARRVATADAAWRLLAMPESTASRNLAQLPCTATADGLLGAAPYGTAEKGARLVWNMAAEVADLLRERRGGRCVGRGAVAAPFCMVAVAASAAPLRASH
ncbi:hypothetical protein JL722_5995 [Aureococcus anophagefferens]|nr:hypothetical protein JL722_5995 [Aureococcus anophagefferens]